MYKPSDDSISETRIVDFGSVPVDTLIEKCLYIKNTSNSFLTYRVSLMYILNSVDQVFKISVTETPVKPLDNAEVKITFKPNLPRQSFTEYFIVDDTAGNTYRLTVTGKCFGPNVSLNKRKLLFRICRNVSEYRKETINIINNSAIDVTYQWLLPLSGQGFFQISIGNCGVIRAFETITATIHFTGTALGIYTGELVCLVLNQEPCFLNAIATVVLPGNPMFSVQNHVFEKNWKRKCRYAHLMENSLKRLSYIPPASVYERYLDFGVGSVSDVTRNISQTLSVTNHELEEGYINWLPDADNIFIIDPVAAVIPPNESILFTIRFRPKIHNEVYGFLMCGEYQYKKYDDDKSESPKIKHVWFRIPCIGNTLDPCAEWATDWSCATEIVLPPTVPTRTTFTNFMISNKLECSMLFKFEAPQKTNFVIMPMCGIVQGRGWQIISVALEPKYFGDYCESWDLVINRVQKSFLTYRVSLMYILNSVDQVFKISVTETPVKPLDNAEVKITFKPNLPRQSFTEYFIVDDTAGNTYRLTVTGKCFGPNVSLNKRKLLFRICRNVSEYRKETINIINNSAIDVTYQWLLPLSGQGFFQISIGNCGVIRAFETITATIHFTGTALGIYTGELVCLVLNQEPCFLNAIATVVLPGNPMFSVQNHVFEKNWKRKCRYAHLMENSLKRLSYIPPASVYERYLDFGVGSVSDVTRNISQTLSVTNHELEEGYINWLPDADNIFIIDPVAAVIPPNESILFTIRFRPKIHNEVYGFLMCGEYQYKKYDDDKSESPKIKHVWFRIPCIGNTLDPCAEWATDWSCATEIVLPPTVPTRTTFTNFMISNKLECSMLFKFEAPQKTNFVIMPMCGIVQGRGWQIISVALEPKYFGDYCESWDLVINRVQKIRICVSGSAETSRVEVVSPGYNPATHAMFEFQPTITGCANYCTAYLHNQTRMEIHIRVLNSVPWLGADNAGCIILPPRELVRFHWWFFPKSPDMVYETTVTCSCICLIDGKAVGEPTEVFISILGFSELPDLRVLPKTTNLHDAVVGNSLTFYITLYNYGSCFFTSKLYHIVQGMGDDHSSEQFDIDSSVNSLKPSNHCEVKMTVVPGGAGPRQVDLKYSVLYRTEFDEIEEIQPVKKTIGIVWYDGIYPTLQVKRTISVKCPVILSNHCLWNMVNVDELNKALMDCRPNKPLKVNLYAPELCIRLGHVKLIFVLGCVYAVPVPWSIRREKICDCEMVEVQVGISTYEMRHTCIHRPLVELTPQNGIVSPEHPRMLHIKLSYAYEGLNTLCYVMTMPNQRSLYIYIHINANIISKGILLPLRRHKDREQYLAELDCGRVPINNLDPVIRILWLYNPTDVYTTWRLLRGNTISPDTVIRCLIYFAEVPPSDKLAIPFAFMPTEMIDYEVVFYCSFGYDTVKILVKGQGGLPNCIETRLDMPNYVERVVRAAYKDDVVYITREHITLRMMPTHSLCREIIGVCNNTDHVIRYIWLPERIANIINIVMTPWWGVVQPRSSEWITMTVYTLQEPATFTTAVTCEILDLTERRRYQKNEYLRKIKTEKCNQEFVITEEGTSHPSINDFPPYVLDLKKPQPFYLVSSISVSSKGQRDGYPRMLLKQMWEQPPSYDLLSSDSSDYVGGKNTTGNNMPLVDIIRLIDGILWDALHSKMFKQQIQYYSKEEIPTYHQLIKRTEKDTRSKLSRRVTSGICDAIVNKAIFHIYNLKSKHEVSILEAE